MILNGHLRPVLTDKTDRARIKHLFETVAPIQKEITNLIADNQPKCAVYRSGYPVHLGNLVGRTISAAMEEING
jgi:hypothetical protein